MTLFDMSHPFSRRDVLKLGGTLFGGITLPRLLEASQSGKEVSCIIFFHEGGLCQLDSFDPKRDAPREIRGSFGTVPTAVPGVHFSELLPRCARLLDRYTVIRTMYSREAIHEKAKQYVYSGQRPNNAFKHPVYGSVVAKELGAKNGLPPFVVIPKKDICAEAGFLGAAFDPFVTGDPSKKNFSVQDLTLPTGVGLEEARGRAGLLAALDGRLESLEQSGVVDGMDYFYQKALDLVSRRRWSRCSRSRCP